MSVPSSNNQPVRFVVWDLDGTLADTAGDSARALDEEALARLAATYGAGAWAGSTSGTTR